MASQRSVKLGEFMMDEKGTLHGTICGLGIGSTDVISEEATSHDGRPYLKLIADPLRTSYEVGAAFPKMKDGMEYYSAHLADHTRPYPGTEEVLWGLQEYKKAVVSNKIESLSVKVLQATELMKYFDYVAGGDTLAEKKPSPIPILDVLSRFDVRPEEALLVGDSIYDIEAGRAAQVRTVAALYGYGAPSFWKQADFRIMSIKELPEIVSQAKRVR